MVIIYNTGFIYWKVRMNSQSKGDGILRYKIKLNALRFRMYNLVKRYELKEERKGDFQKPFIEVFTRETCI